MPNDDEPTDAEIEFEREWRLRKEEHAAPMILTPDSFQYGTTDRDQLRALMQVLDKSRKDNMDLRVRLQRLSNNTHYVQDRREQQRQVIQKLGTQVEELQETMLDQQHNIDRQAEELRVANMKLATCQCRYEFKPHGVVVVTKPMPVETRTPHWLAPALWHATMQFSVVGAIYTVAMVLGLMPDWSAIMGGLMIAYGVPYLKKITNSKPKEGGWI